MSARKPAVSYLIRTFPKLSESFIVRELLALQQAGETLEIWSLLPADDAGIAAVPAAAPLMGLVRTAPRGPRGLLTMTGEFLATLARHPVRALRAIGWALLWSARERDPRHAAALPYAAHLARHAAAPHLHAHFANTPATTAVLAGMLSGKTVSYTGHARDLWVATSPAFLGAKTQRCVFAVSGTQFAVDLMRDACGPGRAPTLEVVTNSVDLPAAEPGGPGGEPGAPPREPGLVVCTARLVEKKGIDVLIRAVATLAADRPSLRLELIGDGPQRAEYEALAASLGAAGSITFRGALPYSEVTVALRRASVFALPAREARDGDTDGLPVAILEALAYGVPVVATPIAGIPEAVIDGETGLLVAPEDVDATAAAIAALIDDPARSARFGAAGRALVAERHDSATSAATLSRLFRSA